jgi:hypothetical protein
MSQLHLFVAYKLSFIRNITFYLSIQESYRIFTNCSTKLKNAYISFNKKKKEKKKKNECIMKQERET